MTSYNIKMELKGIENLEKVLNQTPEAFEDGAKNGLRKVMKDFQTDARKVAPKKTGELRRSIKPDSRITGSIGKGWIRGTVRARALEDGFDYAAYHEYDFPNDTYKKPTTSNTYPHYFKRTLENESRLNSYKNVLADEVYKELKKKGW